MPGATVDQTGELMPEGLSSNGSRKDGDQLRSRQQDAEKGKYLRGVPKMAPVGLHDGLTVGCEAQEDLSIQQKVQMDTQGMRVK